MVVKFLIIIAVLGLLAGITVFLGFDNRSGQPEGDLITSLNSPSPNASVSLGPSQGLVSRNIIVLSPVSGDKVGSLFILKGKARVFENTFVYVLKDANGSEIYKDRGIANASDVNQYGDFEVKVPVPVSAGGKKVTLEVFDYSAKDGSIENLVSVPIEITTKKTMDINVYFTNNKLNPEATCTKTSPIKRQILKTSEVAYMSLYQLIQGPSLFEIGDGYDTNISGQTRINSVNIKNGTAYVDFDEGLNAPAGGSITTSCQATSIKSQIEATLKQFPSIKKVVISINGRTEDILKPSLISN